MSKKTTSYAEIEESKLRDHFAGLAMQSLLNNDQDSSFEVISADAYSIADCMLKARKEVKPWQ